jgi:hypothetical protein
LNKAQLCCWSQDQQRLEAKKQKELAKQQIINYEKTITMQFVLMAKQ